ncbi:DHS-like NAD/FAD-binding domain-containing protein, partial [Baffinella frigidus]
GGRNIVALTGAGISTESGIPDYRSPKGSYSVGHKPMQHDELIGSLANRQRYWARSFQGWVAFRGAEANEGHLAVARLEEMGVLGGIVTQNVDALHQRGGARQVVDLHGRNDRVRCLACSHESDRSERERQAGRERERERERESEGGGVAAGALRADGDAEIGDWATSGIVVPGCSVGTCGGVLKPDVVFFGDVVPDARKQRAAAMVTGASGLLVLGSSLSVLSSFRLAEAAAEAGIPIAIVSIGATRADRAGIKHLKIEERCGPVLSRLSLLLQNLPNVNTT